MLGVLTGLICYFQDLLIFEGITCNFGHDESINNWMRYAGWGQLQHFLCNVCSTCIGEYFSRDSEGSSLPEMKAILAGVYISNFLSIKALIGKFVGVIMAIVGGLSLGRYGSFVHMSVSALFQGHKFELLDKTINILSCSAGCPIAGVIFALELTATYYMLGNLMKGLICATACIITYYCIHNLPLLKPPNFITFVPYQLNHEIILFVLLGYISANISQILINILSKVVFLRSKLKNTLLLNRWKWCFIVALFISVIQFLLKFMHLPERQVWNLMFGIYDIPEAKNGHLWTQHNLELVLVTYCIIKFNFITASLTLPLPNGIFSPMISFSAVFGRLFGHTLNLIGQYYGIQLITSEGIYAVVGADCVYGGATKTISIAVIMFELTGQITLIIPVMTGLAVSYLVSEAITMSIFDVLLEFNNFPFLPSLGSDQTQDLRAKDLTNTNFIYLRQTSQMKDIAHIINKVANKSITIPVLDQQHTLLSTVQTNKLRQYLDKEGRLVKFWLEFRSFQEVKDYNSNLYRDLIHKIPAFSYKDNTYIEQEKFEFMKQQLLKLGHDDIIDFQSCKIQIVESFQNTQINLEDQLLMINRLPTIIQKEAQLMKINFLFIMLNVNTLFVIDKGALIGTITKIEFIRKIKLQNQKKFMIQKNSLKSENLMQNSYEDYLNFFKS